MPEPYCKTEAVVCVGKFGEGSDPGTPHWPSPLAAKDEEDRKLAMEALGKPAIKDDGEGGAEAGVARQSGGIRERRTGPRATKAGAEEAILESEGALCLVSCRLALPQLRVRFQTARTARKNNIAHV